jgi:hypothetical protein
MIVAKIHLSVEPREQYLLMVDGRLKKTYNTEFLVSE